jgi:hypothetical protein
LLLPLFSSTVSYAICFSEIPWGAAIVLAELDTEDDVAVVAVLETDILRSESEVVGVMVVVDFFLPKKAAGYEDSSSACLNVIVEEEDKGLLDWVGDDGEVDFDWPNIIACGFGFGFGCGCGCCNC